MWLATECLLFLKQLEPSCRAAERQAHAATGTVAAALFRRDVDDCTVFFAVGDTCFNARGAREDVVACITFSPFTATRTRERQVSHFLFLFFFKTQQKRSTILRREDPNSFYRNRMLSAPGTSSVPTRQGALQQAQGLHKGRVTKLQWNSWHFRAALSA